MFFSSLQYISFWLSNTTETFVAPKAPPLQDILWGSDDLLFGTDNVAWK